MTEPESFDYIVIGAGSAGCVVAARLSETSASVLLLEAGGPDSHPDVADPTRWPALWKGPMDWCYDTVPQRHLNNRVIHCPRGKMLGGCHSHNASVWVRGHPSDFDNWADQGNPGWDWKSVLPVFKRIEDWHGPTSDYRGTGGPVYVAPPVDPNPVAAAFVQAGPVVGVPVNKDYNGSSMDGVAFFDLTIQDGRRRSVVPAYLKPALGRKNLAVRTGAETRRLVMDGTHCRGVEYQFDGAAKAARANREVILSAGVIGSPTILLHSGIGPADELRALGIPVAVDLPGVGRNLQDHPLLAGIVYEGKGPLPAPRNNLAESTLWWRTDPRLPAPDVQPVFIEVPFVTAEVEKRLPNANCYTIAPSVVRPASRGRLWLTSADVAVPPAIDMNYLARDADLNAMLFAIDLCRAMGASDAFRAFRMREVMPGNLDRSEMIDFVRQATTTYFHPTSTCKMGIDSEAVVDPRLRVHGVTGLRVADASIMPAVTSGNTNAPSVLIGEMAAEMIRNTP